jgi:large subunit ribosomal protein L31
MKKGIHPENYRDVVFRDVSAGESFLIKSTVESDKTTTWEDGKEYPLVDLDVSSASHPFYTGEQRIFDSAGRVEKFQQKYKRK